MAMYFQAPLAEEMNSGLFAKMSFTQVLGDVCNQLQAHFLA